MPKSARDSVLTDVINHLWDAAISPATQTAYQAGLQHFLNFMVMTGKHQGSGLPYIAEDILLQYVAHCYGMHKLRYNTIKLYLCAIRFAYLKNGLPNPLLQQDGHQCFRLFTILRGVKRLQSNLDRPRLPVTFQLLKQLCFLFRTGHFSPYMDLLMEVVSCVAFFGFLRCGEFTVSTGKFDPALHLCLQDVSVAADYFTLKLKSSKTDPFRRGITLHYYRTDNSVCPYLVMVKFLQVRKNMGALPMDPLFVDPSNQVLTRSLFIHTLRSSLQSLHVDQTLYNGHSFRIGAATTAAAVRMEDHLIKTLGRWSSDCYTRYIHVSGHLLRQAQTSLCS